MDSNDNTEVVIRGGEKDQNGEGVRDFQSEAGTPSNPISKMMSAQSAPTPTGTGDSPEPKRRMSRADRAAAKAA